MDTESELKLNAKEFYDSAIQSENEKKFNVAATLFFKTIAVLTDLFILQKEGKIPSNHSERFRILESKYPEIYNILDKDFPFYQDSYRIRLNKEICGVLKNDAKQLIRILKI